MRRIGFYLISATLLLSLVGCGSGGKEGEKESLASPAVQLTPAAEGASSAIAQTPPTTERPQGLLPEDIVGRWLPIYIKDDYNEYEISFYEMIADGVPEDAARLEMAMGYVDYFEDSSFEMIWYYSELYTGTWEIVDDDTIAITGRGASQPVLDKLQDGILCHEYPGCTIHFERVSSQTGERAEDVRRQEVFDAIPGEYCYNASFTDPQGRFVDFLYRLRVERDGDELIITNTWRGMDILGPARVGMDNFDGETFSFLDYEGNPHTLTFVSDQYSEEGVNTLYLDNDRSMPYWPESYEPYEPSYGDFGGGEGWQSSSVPDGTINYFRFKTEVGKYVVRDGIYVLSSAWTWTNNEQVSAHQTRTNDQLPPVSTSVPIFLPNSFSADNCPYNSCSSSVVNMSQATALISTPGN